MDTAELEQNKRALISRLTQKDKNLRERTSRFWTDLELDVVTFDSRKRIADEVEKLNLDDVVAFLESTRLRLAEARVLIYSLGKFQDAPTLGDHLPDRTAFKKATHSVAD